MTIDRKHVSPATAKVGEWVIACTRLARSPFVSVRVTKRTARTITASNFVRYTMRRNGTFANLCEPTPFFLGQVSSGAENVKWADLKRG